MTYHNFPNSVKLTQLLNVRKKKYVPHYIKYITIVFLFKKKNPNDLAIDID